jgi:antitoxin PrlF
MRETQSTVTSKGQVTIPLEIRKLLGVRPHDKIAFVVDGGNMVRIRRTGSVVERTAGALKGPRRRASATNLRQMAEEAIAQEAVERSRG